MGRKSYRAVGPNQDRTRARREVRMAAKSKTSETFGVRRRLSHDSQIPMIECFAGLIYDKQVPDTVAQRYSLHVTEMPKTNMDKQVQRGIVIGYELGRRAVAAKHQIVHNYPQQIDVRLGEANIFKGRHIGFRVESEEMEIEYAAVRQMVSELGIKGTMRDVEPLHITMGEIPRLTRFEKFRALDAMNGVLTEPSQMKTDGSLSTDGTVLQICRMVTLDPMEFYPNS